jgi:hypothetical protein
MFLGRQTFAPRAGESGQHYCAWLTWIAAGKIDLPNQSFIA